jgi:hypothetical protein
MRRLPVALAIGTFFAFITSFFYFKKRFIIKSLNLNIKIRKKCDKGKCARRAEKRRRRNAEHRSA